MKKCQDWVNLSSLRLLTELILIGGIRQMNNYELLKELKEASFNG